MKEQVQQIRELLKQIKEAAPECNSISMSTTGQVSFHGVKSYEDAKSIMRSLGVQKWHKSLYSDGSWISSLDEGEMYFTVFFNGLPPTCRIEEYIEKVPKTSVVTSNDDFVEVKRKRVVCSGAEHEDEQP